MTDMNLVCQDCGASFVWTAKEQEFYQSKGFTNQPKRCVKCRKLKKQRMGENGGFQRTRSYRPDDRGGRY